MRVEKAEPATQAGAPSSLRRQKRGDKNSQANRGHSSNLRITIQRAFVNRGHAPAHDSGRSAAVYFAVVIAGLRTAADITRDEEEVPRPRFDALALRAGALRADTEVAAGFAAAAARSGTGISRRSPSAAAAEAS